MQYESERIEYKQLVADDIYKEAIAFAVNITPQTKTALDYLTKYGKTTDEEFQKLLNIKREEI